MRWFNTQIEFVEQGKGILPKMARIFTLLTFYLFVGLIVYATFFI